MLKVNKLIRVALPWYVALACVYVRACVCVGECPHLSEILDGGSELAHVTQSEPAGRKRLCIVCHLGWHPDYPPSLPGSLPCRPNWNWTLDVHTTLTATATATEQNGSCRESAEKYNSNCNCAATGTTLRQSHCKWQRPWYVISFPFAFVHSPWNSQLQLKLTWNQARDWSLLLTRQTVNLFLHFGTTENFKCNCNSTHTYYIVHISHVVVVHNYLCTRLSVVSSAQCRVLKCTVYCACVLFIKRTALIWLAVESAETPPTAHGMHCILQYIPVLEVPLHILWYLHFYQGHCLYVNYIQVILICLFQLIYRCKELVLYK